MKADDILLIYEQYKVRCGQQVSFHLHEILAEAKEKHQQDLVGIEKDFEQSWRSIKGNALEKMLKRLLVDGLESTPLNLLSGLEGKKKLGDDLMWIREALLIDYAELGKHLPDSDLIVYTTQPNRVVAILSIKTSLRERIAQVAYWTGKTNVPYYLLTIDTDGDFLREVANKSRAIAEKDTDGVYVLTENNIHETGKVKLFQRLVDDLLMLINRA